jgi:hypothetical protein
MTFPTWMFPEQNSWDGDNFVIPFLQNQQNPAPTPSPTPSPNPTPPSTGGGYTGGGWDSYGPGVGPGFTAPQSPADLFSGISDEAINRIRGGLGIGDIQSQLNELNQRVSAPAPTPSPVQTMPEIPSWVTGIGSQISDLSTQLGSVNDRISGMENNFRHQLTPQELTQITGNAIDQRLSAFNPQPQQVDLSGISGQLDQLLNRQMPQVDLSGIQNQISGLGSQISQGFSAIPQPSQVDLSGIQNQISNLGSQINQGFSAIPQPQQIDFSGLQNQISGLGSQINQGFANNAAPDYSGQLNSIFSALSGLSAPSIPSPTLNFKLPIQEKFSF